MLEVEEGTRPGAVAAPEDTGDQRRHGRDERLFLASVAIALLPILVAVVRAARQGWLPIGDNAYFAIRAADTFTEHHPLLGTWTSASLNAGVDFNNPGPLLFQLLAPATKLIDGGIGVAVGAAVLNALAVIGIAVFARRRGGPLLGTAAMAVTALLCWSMGSELLFDPWQPHSLLLPFLCLLMLVWSLACGDVRALPWAVGIASVILQSHLSYAVLLVLLGAWSSICLVLALRRDRLSTPESWPTTRRSVVRTGIITVIVAVLCWAQPIFEQVTTDGDGNMSRLAGNMTASEQQVGLQQGTRIVADVLLPPFWFRPSFGEALRPDLTALPMEDQLTTLDPSFGLAVLLLTGAGGVMLLCWLSARRRSDRTSRAALSTGLVAAAGCLLTAWNLPFGVFGVPPHQFRWLWPVSAFITFAIVTLVVRRDWSHPSNPANRFRWNATATLALVTAVVALGNLPTNNQRSGPSHDDWAIPVVRDLNAQMGALEGEGTLLIDVQRIRFAEPYSGPVMAELQRRDIPFVVEDEGMVRQLGSGRRLQGEAQRLEIIDGPGALVGPAGSRRMALVEGLDGDEQQELEVLAAQVGEHLETLGTVPLTPAGSRALQRPDRANDLALVESTDVDALLESRVLAFLIESDLLDLDADVAPGFERYADLQRRWDRATVALYLKPFDT